MTDLSPAARRRVDLQPVGRRAEIAAGDTLLDAARSAGVELVALCGGQGWCHSCIVRLVSGAASEPSLTERDALSPAQIEEGYRLACQAVPLTDVKLDIPPESLTTPQRLNIEGREVAIELDPLVTPLDVTLSPPTSHDQIADATRLTNACTHKCDAQGVGPVAIASEVLADLSERLRDQGWQARVAVRRPRGGEGPGEIVAVLRPGTPLFGLAVDIGTTKLAAYLVDLATGETVAKAGAMNPQIAYGEDVISRIQYCGEHADGRTVLKARLVETLNTLVAQLCRDAGIVQEQIVDAVVVGNTVMHHLFAGLPVAQLARAPYVAAVSEALELRGSDLGLTLAPGAQVYLPPNIAGFVGADHVAMALATGAWEETERCVVALDIGTNTEVTLTKGGRSWCCSCASGPAFEGAHIEDGMRAAPGAIERVQIVGGQPHVKTIGDQPPVGICGSGIVDAVSELHRAGIIDRRGVFLAGAPGVRLAPRRRPLHADLRRGYGPRPRYQCDAQGYLRSAACQGRDPDGAGNVDGGSRRNPRRDRRLHHRGRVRRVPRRGQLRQDPDVPNSAHRALRTGRERGGRGRAPAIAVGAATCGSRFAQPAGDVRRAYSASQVQQAVLERAAAGADRAAAQARISLGKPR